MRTMWIKNGSSISADSKEIMVRDENELLFHETYHAGYSYAWRRDFATEKKPYIDDLIQSIADKFKVSSEHIIHSDDGENVFRDSLNKSEQSKNVQAVANPLDDEQYLGIITILTSDVH